ncbi:restriction endonuclease subunit S, partial [Enterococcus mundtii]|uniref:restriction endonuclease subunit S n=1 Tax=Enterococcus mundtii TaxID=53346 RepID=UPI00280BB925
MVYIRNKNSSEFNSRYCFYLLGYRIFIGLLTDRTPKYAFYFLRYLYSQNIVLKFQNKTTGIINLKLNDYLEKIEIQIPSLLVQQKIADILDLSSELIEKRKDQIAEMDKLVQSMFEEVLSKEKCSTVNFDELIVSSKNGLSRRAQDEDGDVVLKIPNIQPSGMYQIFERINTGGKILKSQEIRNCIYQGDMNSMLIKLNREEIWRKILQNEKLDSRMLDIELILRFFSMNHLYNNITDAHTINLTNYL